MNTLQEILTVTNDFLARKPSFEEIKDFLRRSDMQLNLQIDVSTVYTTKPQNVAVDRNASLFLPEEYKNHVCGVATGDGSCLFNSASLFLVGDESLSLTLRVATIHELLSHPEAYLNIPVFTTDWPWSDDALNTADKSDSDNREYRKASIYKREIASFCHPYAYTPLLALFGLASVMTRPINSIYPAIRCDRGRAPFNRLILPRQTRFQPSINVLWTRVGIKTQAEFDAWRSDDLLSTNHFVPVFESSPDTLKIIPVNFTTHNPLIVNNVQMSTVNNKPNRNRYVAALMAGIDLETHMDVKVEAGDTIKYESVNDTVILLDQDEVNKLISIDFHWQDQYSSHYWLHRLVQSRGLFPQIAITVTKTRESAKSLRKYFCCSGCVDKQNSTSGVISIERQELEMKADTISLNINFTDNRRCCMHYQNVSYGQTRGLSAALLREKDKLPRQLRAERLGDVPIQQKLTGNRQDVPSPQAARKLKQVRDYTTAERFHSSIRLINSEEKLKYAKNNSEDAEEKRKLRGYIQVPVIVNPLSLPLYNEASLSYYHYYASNNPGVFLDYTGLMINDIYNLIQEKPLTADEKSHPVLNAIMTLPSGNSRSEPDAPPVLAAEFIVTDLSARHLAFCLQNYRLKEYEIFRSNVIPYLIQTDCARGILRAVLLEYNGETPKEYMERLLTDTINGNEPDERKVVMAWCYGHCIRAVRGHVRAANFNCQPGIDKKNIINAAIRIWCRVQNKTAFSDADRETKLWNWLLNQQYLELTNFEVDLENIGTLLVNNFNTSGDNNIETNELLIGTDDTLTNNNNWTIDGDCVPDNYSGTDREWTYMTGERTVIKISQIWTDITENGNNVQPKNGLRLTIRDRQYVVGYLFVVPDLQMKISIMPDLNGRFFNPLYSPELSQYFRRQWWSCIVLWSNLIKRIAERERRTTATIEVHHKILKTMDIAKRRLPLDQYLYARAAVIRDNQLLIAEKLMFAKSKMALKKRQPANDDESWSKDIINLSPAEKRILDDFSKAYRIRERRGDFTQRVCAQELRDLSDNKVGVNQSTISRMLNKKYIPHDQTTINAIKMWVKQTNDELDLLEKGLILDADQDQSIIEEVCQSIEKKEKEKM